MNDKQESKKKKAGNAEAPIHTVHAGCVSASIWRRQSPAGYEYLDFSLNRSFESLSSGNTGHSRNFFARNRQELLEVIEHASRWITRHESGTADSESTRAREGN